MPNRPNATLHLMSPCTTYSTVTDDFNTRIADLQNATHAIVFLLLVATSLTLWVSHKDRLRHQVKQASTITCRIQKIVSATPLKDPSVYVMATMMPDNEARKTETFTRQGEVSSITLEEDSADSQMHFTLHPFLTNVLYLELWSLSTSDDNSTPKLLGHHQIPIDEVKWFNSQDYYIEPATRAVSELGEYYDQFVGYHWLRWSMLFVSWAQSLLRSIVHKVEGCCAGGNYKTDNVAAIRCEFSIPSGMLVATRGEGKLSVTEQVQVFVEETVDRTGQTRNEGPSPSSARHHNDDHHSLRPRAIGKITV